jgi:hypothetical protein
MQRQMSLTHPRPTQALKQLCLRLRGTLCGVSAVLLSAVLVLPAHALTTFSRTPALQKYQKYTASEHFSHAVFDSLLQMHVAGGRVYYEGFACAAFDEYRTALARVQPVALAAWQTEERLAFWLNAYNASVIATVLKHPAMLMPANVQGFFDADTVRVAGEIWTLQTLTNTIRSDFAGLGGLPLMGMCSGTKSSPKLAKRAFRAATVLKQLQTQAKQFLRSDEGAVLDIATNTLRLARLFFTYKQDFERSGQPLVKWLVPYVRDTEAAYIALHLDDLVLAPLNEDLRLNRREMPTEHDAVKPYQKPNLSPASAAKRIRKR